MPNLKFVKQLCDVVSRQLKNKTYQEKGAGYAELETVVGYLCKATDYNEEEAKKDFGKALAEIAQGINFNKKIINNVKLSEKIAKYLNRQPDAFGIFTNNDLKSKLLDVIKNPDFQRAYLLEMQLEDQKKYIKENELGNYDIELKCPVGFAEFLQGVIAEYQQKAAALNPELLTKTILADIEQLKAILNAGMYGQSYTVLTKDTATEAQHALFETTVKHRIIDHVKIRKEVVNYFNSMYMHEFKNTIREVLRAPAYTYENLLSTDIKHYKTYIKALEKAKKEDQQGLLKEKEELIKNQELVGQEKIKTGVMEEQFRMLFQDQFSRLQAALVGSRSQPPAIRPPAMPPLSIGMEGEPVVRAEIAGKSELAQAKETVGDELKNLFARGFTGPHAIRAAAKPRIKFEISKPKKSIIEREEEVVTTTTTTTEKALAVQVSDIQGETYNAGKAEMVEEVKPTPKESVTQAVVPRAITAEMSASVSNDNISKVGSMATLFGGPKSRGQANITMTEVKTTQASKTSHVRSLTTFFEDQQTEEAQPSRPSGAEVGASNVQTASRSNIPTVRNR